MAAPALELLPGEQLLLRCAGILDITNPQNVNIVVTFVSGIFFITDQRLLFIQEEQRGVGDRPPKGLRLEILRKDITGTRKKRLSQRLFVDTNVGSFSLSVPKWREFAALLDEKTAEKT